MESGLNREVFLALGAVFTTWADIARIAVGIADNEMKLGVQAKVIAPAGETKHQPGLVNVAKIKRTFGLSFDAAADLRDHVRWNLERERKALAGEAVHNVCREWSK